METEVIAKVPSAQGMSLNGLLEALQTIRNALNQEVDPTVVLDIPSEKASWTIQSVRTNGSFVSLNGER